MVGVWEELKLDILRTVSFILKMLVNFKDFKHNNDRSSRVFIKNYGDGEKDELERGVYRSLQYDWRLGDQLGDTSSWF